MTLSAMYFDYWGKSKSSTAPHSDYHLLPYHSLDVSAVGQQLLCPEKPLTQDLAGFLGISVEQLTALFTFSLSLHDLGKFASAFQGLYQAQNGALIIPNSRFGYDGAKYRHDRMGLYFWQGSESYFCEKIFLGKEPSSKEGKAFRKSMMVLMHCVLGHHGQPIDTKDVSGIKPYTEPDNLDAARAFILDVYDLIQPDFPLDKFCDKNWRERLKQVSWQLAGIAVLADWVGSNQDHFSYRCEPMALSQYWLMAQSNAKKALAASGLSHISKIAPFHSFKHHFGFVPTPLQTWAEQVEINDSPQLFILEDVTGSGKTEAALTLTHRLMAVGAAEGFYFGLPTMATSNAMFGRIADHYQQMLTGEGSYQPSIVLAHGAREMNYSFQQAILRSGPPDFCYEKSDNTATAQCNQWLADSRKKSLLASVGVGTIDQALLAVLPRRHQSLRLLGLNRKVLIFDEVHSADEYMFELLEHLLALHLHQGGSVILLTATLSLKQRQRLADIWLNAAGLPTARLQETAFPLATQIKIDSPIPVKEQALATRTEVSREIGVSVVHSEQACVDMVLSGVAEGQCVVWVRNTVNDALASYLYLQKKLDNPDDCILFHSRFILNDRKRIENNVLDIFGKLSDGKKRRGKVLIATQVFQESLDADADVMISDLCPIDDLIQRAGRLHRHTRNAQGAYEEGIKDERSAPVLFVHAPPWDPNPTSDWLSRQFQGTQYVYRSPGRLWLGLRELMHLGAIRMPAEARQLIEAVYSDDAYEHIPSTLIDKENELIRELGAKAAKASSQRVMFDKGYSDKSSKYWAEDQHDISTRYSDIETVSILVLRQSPEGDYIPWVDDPKFAVALSTVKVSKQKYADKLISLTESQIDLVHRAYPPSRYLQLWLPEQDPKFTYDAKMGFFENAFCENPR